MKFEVNLDAFVKMPPDFAATPTLMLNYLGEIFPGIRSLQIQYA